jgi:hypothetical protein
MRDEGPFCLDFQCLTLREIGLGYASRSTLTFQFEPELESYFAKRGNEKRFYPSSHEIFFSSLNPTSVLLICPRLYCIVLLGTVLLTLKDPSLLILEV